MTTIEVKVDTMWDFTLRRARSEAVNNGYATINSPLVFSDEARGWLEPFASLLRDLYVSMGDHVTDTDLAVEIERIFGVRLLNEICIPHHMYMGACLLLAMDVA